MPDVIAVGYVLVSCGGRFVSFMLSAKLFALQTKKNILKTKISFKGFKRPEKNFAIKYYIIEIKTLCIPLKNNFLALQNAFEHKKTSILATFPPFGKLSNGLPFVPFSLPLGHTMRVTFVSFCQEQKVLHCKQK